MSPNDEIDGLPVLDEAQLLDVTGGDTDFASMILEEYRNASLPLMAQLETAVSAADAHAVHQAAHALKGSSATIGGVAFARLCQRIESIAEGGSMAGIDALMATARPAFEALQGALRNRAA